MFAYLYSAGELTVFCLGPSPDWPALSELKEEDSWGNGGGGGSGVFTLIVRAQDVGMHRLHIRYNGQDVTGEQRTKIRNLDGREQEINDASIAVKEHGLLYDIKLTYVQARILISNGRV